MIETVNTGTEMSEETYEFVYQIRVIWDRKNNRFDYYYVPIARPPVHNEEERKMLSITMSLIETAIYWGGLGRLCEETEEQEE